jgi:hypothetical protein
LELLAHPVVDFQFQGNLTGGIIRTSSNGTAAVPAYTFSNDLTTGAFLAGVSNLALTTAGVERLRILPSGNVGIATPNPGFTLDVSGTANISGNLSVGSITTAGGGFSVPGNLTGGIIRSSSNGTAALPAYTFSNDLTTGAFLAGVSNLALTTAGVERLRIISNGNVGIAIAAPTEKLHVSGNAILTGTLSAGATTVASLNAGSGSISNSGTLTTGAATVSSLNSAGNISNSGTLTTGAATVSSLNSAGNISNSGTLTTGAATVSSLNSAGNISNSGTLTTGAATVTSLNAGSGAITTTGSLSCIGLGAGSGSINTSATVYANRILGSGSSYSTAAAPTFGFQEMDVNYNIVNDGIFKPATGVIGISTYGVERMRIAANGNVGIGRADPSNALDVNGSVRITSNLSAGATTVSSLNSAGNISNSGTLTTGAATVSSLNSAGNISNSGTLTTGAATVSSLNSAGNISNSGTLTTGGATVSSLNANSGSITTSSNLLTTTGSAAIPSHTFSGNTTVGMFSPGTNSVAWSTASTERMRILANGNVGIGTTNPTVLFDVNGATKTTTLSATSASITDVSLTTINGSKYFSGGASGRTFKLNYSGSPTTTVSIFAGINGSSGSDNGGVGVGKLNLPASMAVDSTGAVYVVDGNSTKIRKVSPLGVISDFVNISGITSLCVDNSDTLFGTKGNQIWKITSLGVATEFVGQAAAGYGDGSGASIFLNTPVRITVDSAGTLYVTEGQGHRVRKITSSGVASTLAGSTAGTVGTTGTTDGLGTNARFNNPAGIGLDSAGNVYVADGGNHLIRKITPSGNVTTLAGRAGVSGSSNGSGTNATFTFSIDDVVVDRDDNVYILDRGNGLVRKIDKDGVVSTFNSSIVAISRLAIQRNTSDTLYAGEQIYHIIRKIATTRDSTYAGTTLTGTLDTDFATQLTSSLVTVPASTTNAKIMSFSLSTSSPSSILGQWILGLYASVALPASPASFYFEIMNGTSIVATGSTSPTSINLSTPLQVYTTSLLIPARAYGALVVNLYATTQASSALTIGFNGLNISYLSTPIQLFSVDTIQTSDRRVKTDIQTISNALDIVNGLRGVYFTRIGQTKQLVGVIAQEIEPLLPQVVYTDSEGLKSVSYGNMVGLLIEALKDVSKRLETLEKKG